MTAEIPQDLAEKLLAANLRNIVKRVSEGQSISQGEYETMQRAAIDGTLPEELQKARLAALARLYALGRPLSKGQQIELSALIPVGKPIAKKLTTESYRYKLAHYVTVIGLQGRDPERKLKRWIAKGREQTPPDLPPFDAPHLMAEWWRRNMEWRVPDYIASLERCEEPEPRAASAAPIAPAPVEASPASTNTPALPPASAETGLPMMFEAGSEMTADLGLAQIRGLVQTLYTRMKQAFEGGRLTEGQNFMRQWERAVENLRKWEKDLVKIQEGKGEVLRTRVINTELGRIFGVISQSYFNSFLALLDKYAPDISATDRRQLALSYRDKCFAHMKTTRFSSVYQPTAHE